MRRRPLASHLDHGAQALVGVRGRHAYVDHAQVGPVRRACLDQRGPVAHRGDHVVPGLGEQQLQPLAQQHRVVGDDYPHGSSARTTVGPPRGEVMSSKPSAARARCTRPARPPSGVGIAPPCPSSSTTHDAPRRRAIVDRDVGRGRAAVLGHVGQALGRRRSRPCSRRGPAAWPVRRRPAWSGRPSGRPPRAARPPARGRPGPAGRCRGRATAAPRRSRGSALSAPSMRLAGLLGVVVELGARAAEVHRQADQALLGTVVDVALEPAQRLGLGDPAGGATGLGAAYLLLELGATAQQVAARAWSAAGRRARSASGSVSSATTPIALITRTSACSAGRRSRAARPG